MDVRIEICPVNDMDVWHCDLVITNQHMTWKSRWKMPPGRQTKPITAIEALTEAMTQFVGDLKTWAPKREEKPF
jgi:hypothetical protein